MKFKIPAVTEKLAPAIHETWRELGRKEGWLKKQNDVELESRPGIKVDELAKIAGRSSETQLAFATDEDVGFVPGHSIPGITNSDTSTRNLLWDQS